MAVAFQTSAAGRKTLTTGTTFTIALNSTAGDCIVVAIAQPSGASAVSNVTDGGGNTYHKVGNLGNTVQVELWKTDKVNPAASGTITVTVVTGFLADGSAASYRGVAFAGEAAATNSATSGTLSSGSRTLRETLGTGEVVTAGGETGNTDLTASTGNLRRQGTGVTGARSCIMDSEGNASPVTNSATLTSTTWAAVSVELRPLSVTDNEGANWSDGNVAKTVGLQLTSVLDIFTMQDGLGAGYGNSIPDVLELLDADSTNQLAGKQDIDYNGWAHWMEDYRHRLTNSVTSVTSLFLPVKDGNERTKVLSVSGNPSVTITETLVWQDGTPKEILQFGLGIICPHLGDNWLDAVLSLSGIAKIFSDTLTMSDSLGAGYGDSTSDQLVIVDSLGAGYGAVLSDSLNNWLDNLVVGRGLFVSDNAGGTWSDFVAAGYGSSTSDQLVISDSIGAGYGFVLSDNLNNWLDAFSEQLTSSGPTPINLTLSDDDGANWLDFLAAGYGSLTSDQIVIVDSLGTGYGGSLSDQLTSSDQLAVGYGNSVSDNLNSWLDSAQAWLGLCFNLSDTLNNWLDFLAAGYGNSISDQLVISDTTVVGYGSATSDQIVFTDSLGSGYGAGLSDTLTIADSLGLGYGCTLSDSLNNWLDAVVDVLGFGLGLSDNDGANWLDSMLAGYGSGVSDQIVVVDSLSAGYGFVLSDNLNSWLDSVNTFLNQPLIQLTLSDDGENNWLDSLIVGYGSATSDQIIIVDSLGAGYGAVLSDNDTFWLDAVSSIFGFGESLSDTESANWLDKLAAGYGSGLSDQIVIVDSLGAGYGAVLSDNLNNWLDQVSLFTNQPLIQLTLSDDNETNWLDRLGAGYGSSTSDQIVLVDSVGAGYGAVLSDNLNNWLDTASDVFGFVETLSDNGNNLSDRLGTGYGNTVSDQIVIADFLGAGYGASTSDQLVIVESVGAGYGAVLSDSGNFWADQFGVGSVLVVSLSDNANFWLDSLASLQSFGLTTSDSVILSDSFGMGYGSAMSDQLPMQDAVSAGYGISLGDTGNFWDDFFTTTGLFPYVFAFSDSTAFWSDAASEFLATNTGPAILQSLSIAQRGTPSYVLVVGRGLASGLKIYKDPLSITNYGSGSADDTSSLWFDQVGISVNAAAGMGLSLGDSLSVWSDSTVLANVFSGLFMLSLFDALVLQDNLGLGYSLAIGDIGQLSDNVLAIDPATTLVLLLSETLNQWSDVTSVREDMLISTSDISGNWLDSVSEFVASSVLSVQASDLITWSDVLAKQFGFKKAVTDSAPAATDAVSHSVIATLLTLQFNETLNNWLDFMPGFTQDYGLGIGENMSGQWAESITKLLS